MDITNACNLKCIHCYRPDTTERDLPFSDWLKILDQYAALADKLALKPCIALCGGEATISPLFSPLLRELRHRWPEAPLTLITNGTALSPDAVSAIKSCGVAVQISMDGPDEGRNDIIRGQGAFSKMMASVSILKSVGIDPAFQAVLSLRTSSWIPEFFKTAARLQADSMSFTRFVPQGRGARLAAEQADRPLTKLELRDAYVKIVECSRAAGIPTSTNLPLFVLVDSSLGAHGKAGFQGLVVDHRGNLKLTSRADFRLGSVLGEGLENLFLNHPVMNDLRAGHIEGCGTCGFYDRCGGDRNAAFVEYGSFLKRDPGCWLRT